VRKLRICSAPLTYNWLQLQRALSNKLFFARAITCYNSSVFRLTTANNGLLQHVCTAGELLLMYALCTGAADVSSEAGGAQGTSTTRSERRANEKVYSDYRDDECDDDACTSSSSSSAHEQVSSSSALNLHRVATLLFQISRSGRSRHWQQQQQQQLQLQLVVSMN
jgi:hypothetical protein